MEGIQESRDFIGMTGLDSFYVPERKSKLDSFVDPEIRADKPDLIKERVFETISADGYDYEEEGRFDIGNHFLRLGAGLLMTVPMVLLGLPAILLGSAVMAVSIIPNFVATIVALISKIPLPPMHIWRFRPLKLVEAAIDVVTGWILVPGMIITSVGLTIVDATIPLFTRRPSNTRKLGLERVGGRWAVYKKLLFPWDKLKQFYEAPKKKGKKASKSKKGKGKGKGKKSESETEEDED